MKTLIVSLAALVAVSGAALAESSSRSSDSHFTLESSATDSNAFAVVKAGTAKPTAFERMNMLQGEDKDNKARELRAPAKM